MSASEEGYVEGFVCTLDTCSVEDWGYVRYRPSVAGNALFLAVMAVLAACQLVLGIRHKTKSFAVAMCLGLITEAVGYIARVLMNGNPFNRDYFLWYLITLTIGPVFIAAAIYLTLGRIVVVYGENISRIKPRSYTTFFLACDIVSLCVQAVGGGIAASTPVTDQAMVLHPLYLPLFFYSYADDSSNTCRSMWGQTFSSRVSRFRSLVCSHSPPAASSSFGARGSTRTGAIPSSPISSIAKSSSCSYVVCCFFVSGNPGIIQHHVLSFVLGKG